MKRLVTLTAGAFAISEDVILSRVRRIEAVRARWAVFWLARKRYGLSDSEIGRQLGANHVTVGYGIRGFEAEFLKQNSVRIAKIQDALDAEEKADSLWHNQDNMRDCENCVQRIRSALLTIDQTFATIEQNLKQLSFLRDTKPATE